MKAMGFDVLCIGFVLRKVFAVALSLLIGYMLYSVVCL